MLCTARLIAREAAASGHLQCQFSGKYSRHTIAAVRTDCRYNFTLCRRPYTWTIIGIAYSLTLVHNTKDITQFADKRSVLLLFCSVWAIGVELSNLIAQRKKMSPWILVWGFLQWKLLDWLRHKYKHLRKSRTLNHISNFSISVNML